MRFELEAVINGQAQSEDAFSRVEAELEEISTRLESLEAEDVS